MTRTIEHCKVMYYYGKPRQNNGVCEGVILRGNLLEKCAKCHLHDINNARRICAECGKEFFSPYPNIKFCSKKCKDINKQKPKQPKKVQKKKTLDEVLADLDEYNKTHGTHLTYGKYQDMLFKETLKNEKNRKKLC